MTQSNILRMQNAFAALIQAPTVRSRIWQVKVRGAFGLGKKILEWSQVLDSRHQVHPKAGVDWSGKARNGGQSGSYDLMDHRVKLAVYLAAAN